ncbi:Arm DNA-binding domain-containing protein [Paralcaligenes ureilyticus]|uniref:Integrase DNA-binding domain-containing protein n=1 Tax=Paralcaligenes ureilyticus TaxID=627131 RepID=A0A4R3MCU3_9BURK|nr:hypothetical protein EDC26_101174 [Paralcaligenes ureilyticus]
MALTDVQVRQTKPAEKPYALRDGTGLYLEVKPAGKYWCWDYRYQSKRKTIAYGGQAGRAGSKTEREY